MQDPHAEYVIRLFGTGYADSSATAGGRIYASFTYTDPEITSEKLRKFQGSLQEYNLEMDTWTEKLSIPDGSVPEMASNREAISTGKRADFACRHGHRGDVLKNLGLRERCWASRPLLAD